LHYFEKVAKNQKTNKNVKMSDKIRKYFSCGFVLALEVHCVHVSTIETIIQNDIRKGIEKGQNESAAMALCAQCSHDRFLLLPVLEFSAASVDVTFFYVMCFDMFRI
jgi:hypothetical protein